MTALGQRRRFASSLRLSAVVAAVLLVGRHFALAGRVSAFVSLLLLCHRHLLKSDGVTARVAVFELDAESRPREIRMELALCRLGCPVEEHVLDAHVIVEIFEMDCRT